MQFKVTPSLSREAREIELKERLGFETTLLRLELEHETVPMKAAAVKAVTEIILENLNIKTPYILFEKINCT